MLKRMSGVKSWVYCMFFWDFEQYLIVFSFSAKKKKKSKFLTQSTQFLEQYYIKLIFQSLSLLNTTVHVVGDDTYSSQSYHIL